jgi:preprotein translocase subunit SecG
VLLQRAQSDSGMAAMGGGMVESAFGPDTSNVLGKFTIRTTVVFFILSFLLYLGYVRIRSHGSSGKGTLPNISASAALPSVPGGNPAPAAAQPAAPAVSAPPAAPDAATTTTPSSAKSKTP